MQKLSLTQSLTQKLSPQQIQFIKLLQVPTVELESRIEEELEVNPALEEGRDEPDEYQQEEIKEREEEREREDEFNVEDYLKHDDIGGYKMQGDTGGQNEEEDREMPIVGTTTLADALNTQLGYLGLDERKEIIAQQLLGSIESDGYIRRDLDAIANDLAFSQNIETTEEELSELLDEIQLFDPPGIGARDLRECLLIQLKRKEDHDDPSIGHAIRILEETFTEFTRKHYAKIQKKLGIDEQELRDAIQQITRLNPKPGSTAGTGGKAQYIIPDFILTNDNGKLQLSLNARNAPELRVSRSYSEMLMAYDKAKHKDKKMKETVSFVKQKLDSAKWFIDAIKQRQQTLLKTMSAILEYQREFFLEGDESKLRPMILKDIAEEIDMDISTVSRVASSKSVQTEFGIFPLKYFFSESISTDSGEDVSSREVKYELKQIIESEDKQKPFSDDKIEKMLKEKGYNIARRTVAKYREQLNIPVARLRKEL